MNILLKIGSVEVGKKRVHKATKLVEKKRAIEHDDETDFMAYIKTRFL